MLGSSTQAEAVPEFWPIDTGLLPNTGAGAELGGLENKSCARDCSKAACLACLLGGSALGWMAVTVSGRGEGFATLHVGLVIKEAALLCEGCRDRMRARAMDAGAKCVAADGARDRPEFVLGGFSEDGAVVSFGVEVGAEGVTSAARGSFSIEWQASVHFFGGEARASKGEMNSNFDLRGWLLVQGLKGSPEWGGVGDANAECCPTQSSVAGRSWLAGRSTFVAAAADGVALGVGSAPLFGAHNDVVTGVDGCIGVD